MLCEYASWVYIYLTDEEPSPYHRQLLLTSKPLTVIGDHGPAHKGCTRQEGREVMTAEFALQRQRSCLRCAMSRVSDIHATEYSGLNHG